MVKYHKRDVSNTMMLCLFHRCISRPSRGLKLFYDPVFVLVPGCISRPSRGLKLYSVSPVSTILVAMHLAPLTGTETMIVTSIFDFGLWMHLAPLTGTETSLLFRAVVLFLRCISRPSRGLKPALCCMIMNKAAARCISRPSRGHMRTQKTDEILNSRPLFVCLFNYCYDPPQPGHLKV